ncbi:MAG: TlyA family RNA methyltransferase [Clostridia bacterium]|nr:TlyA family RNA methyltransferase [Clostridia bacterium]
MRSDLIRADIRLVELELAKSREKARALIMAGVVYKNGQKLNKSGTFVTKDDKIEVREDPIPYVSRGGLKLEKAIKNHGVDVNGKISADIGASTGGFTDCMLQNGAKKVYAIDVGYGQLDWKLRNDKRVVVMERTNARNMEPSWFSERIELASIDVSFISLKLILPALFDCLTETGEVLALVKPQFEAGREKIGKNGVVRNRNTHAEVLKDIALFSMDMGFKIRAIDYSPITGPKGNIEFLLLLKKGEGDAFMEIETMHERIEEITILAHTNLKRENEEDEV